MSDDWDSATVIGAKARGNANRTNVAKTNAEINAARRSGTVVATEKKVLNFLYISRCE
jgi:putative transcription factor